MERCAYNIPSEASALDFLKEPSLAPRAGPLSRSIENSPILAIDDAQEHVRQGSSIPLKFSESQDVLITGVPARDRHMHN